MHGAENQQDSPQFAAEEFAHLEARVRMQPGTEQERGEGEVDEVITDQQQVIDGIGQSSAAGEAFDEKRPSVMMQLPPHHHGDVHRRGEIGFVTLSKKLMTPKLIR